MKKFDCKNIFQSTSKYTNSKQIFKSQINFICEIGEQSTGTSILHHLHLGFRIQR
jgi:hypothetical protein